MVKSRGGGMVVKGESNGNDNDNVISCNVSLIRCNSGTTGLDVRSGVMSAANDSLSTSDARRVPPNMNL